MKLRRAPGLAVAALLLAGCGGSTPVAPVTVASVAPAPMPAPVPTPTPVPADEEELCDGCEPPVSNRNSPVRLTLRLYTLEDGLGQFIRNPNPLEAIPLNWFARLDVVAKDADGDETNGNEEVIWHFSAPSLVRISGNHTHQRRLKALEPGYLEVWTTQEGVRSNTIGLTFGP
jgi:hypothetical protein